MSDSTKQNPVTAEDATVRPNPATAESVGAQHPEGAADSPTNVEETDFVAVGGPRSGGEEVGGTQDSGINPADEIPSAG